MITKEQAYKIVNKNIPSPFESAKFVGEKEGIFYFSYSFSPENMQDIGMPMFALVDKKTSQIKNVIDTTLSIASSFI